MEIHLKIFSNYAIFPEITCYVAMTSIQFHIFCSPSYTWRDEGLKLCIHNLIHTIKHISWCKFWSATLCHNCGICVIPRGFLKFKTKNLYLQSKYLGDLNHKCTIFLD